MLEKVKGGYKVKREHGKGYFSKKPQTKAKAMAQLRVIEAAKHGKHYSEMDEAGPMAGDGMMERADYCGCGCSESPKPVRKPYRLARVAGGRVRVEYTGMAEGEGYDDVLDPPATPADARKYLKRRAMCSMEKMQ